MRLRRRYPLPQVALVGCELGRGLHFALVALLALLALRTRCTAQMLTYGARGAPRLFCNLSKIVTLLS